jgi:hypothetical protein
MLLSVLVFVGSGGICFSSDYVSFLLVLVFCFSPVPDLVVFFGSGRVLVVGIWSFSPELHGSGLGSCRSSVVHHRVGGFEPWW